MSMGGPAGWQLMHSYRRDSSVTQKQLPPGTVRRIARFAAPYKRQLVWFLGLVIVDAVIGAANPWIVKIIIDEGIRQHRRGLVIGLALLMVGLALLAAVINLANRWFSARIGEGLIYDMRSGVFRHIQRMPIAFFTRTQTGALISRINNDVLGAQQAFTGTLSNVVSNAISVTLVLVAMLLLSWQITLLALGMIPLFIIPARLMSKRLQRLTREAYALNAEMSTQMTERFNVSGALLVKLFGRPDDEDGMFRSKARRVADIGVQQAMFARVLFVSFTLVAAFGTALVYGMGGYQAATDPEMLGTVVALAAYLNRLYGPITALSNVQVDVMTALVSFDRVFEVMDLPPSITDKDDAVVLRKALDGDATIEFDHVSFRYPTAAEVSLASLESVAVLDNTPAKAGAARRVLPGRAGPAGGARRAVRRR